MAKSNETFTMGVIGRDKIKFSEYNPRYMEDSNFAVLKKGIEKNGLVMPIVVNKKTMRVVNGHQRVKALDSINRNKSYELTVAFIDVDDEQEKEINVLLNNPNAMGEYDFEKLGALYKEGLSPENMGFTAADMLEFFGNSAIELEVKEIDDLARRLEELKEADRNVGKDEREEQAKGYSEYDFYNVLVFKDSKQRAEFCQKLGLKNKSFICGDYLLKKLMGEDTGDSKWDDQKSKKKK